MYSLGTSVLEVFHQEPIVSFAVLLAVILVVPIIFERLRLPGLVGLLAAGIVLGPNGLKLLQTESETMRLLSDIGLVYLMFVAGLEVDIEQFRKTKHRSAGFGFLTFIVPLIFGTVIGRWLGFGWNASILIGSLFASHTLLAYPIVSRLGVVGNEAVTITIGATIFTDVGALLVLAICIGIHAGNFTVFNLATLIGSLLLYSAIVLFGFDWVGRRFFRHSISDEGSQFLFVLLALFLAALGAQLIGVEKIVGAFLAGLAVNDALGEGPVKDKVIFVGSVLFIPIFFVDMGLLINVPAFIKTLTSFQVTLTIVLGLIVSKFLAALLAKLAYRYNWQEMLTMWSLSLPQVAATLAATLVGYRAKLLTEEILNSVIVLMLVTAILGPLITARFARGLSVADSNLEVRPSSRPWEVASTDEPFTVVVPVYNPQTEQYLIEMAALLVRQQAGRIVPLSIATAPAYLGAPQLEGAMDRGQRLLNNAMELSRSFGVEAEPLIRIDDNIAQGINRASREQQANLIIMGWGKRTGFRARLFGNVIDSVLAASHCPVAITRLLESPTKLRRILVPIDNLNQQALRSFRFAQVLAGSTEAHVTLLHVCDRNTTPSKIAWNQSQLALLANRGDSTPGQTAMDIQVVPADDITRAIVNASKAYDLVVLRSMRQQTSAGGLMISNLTSQITQQITCSLVLLGEPQQVLLPTSQDTSKTISVDIIQ